MPPTLARWAILLCLSLVLVFSSLGVVYGNPVPTTVDARDITASSAVLLGLITTNGVDTQWWFVIREGAATNSQGEMLSPIGTVPGSRPVDTVTYIIAGLKPSTTYFFNLFAKWLGTYPNQAGVYMSFVTMPPLAGATVTLFFDFSISLSPSSVSVKQGETASYQILISYSDPSYSGTSITVQVTGLGPGMNYQLAPSPPALSISTSQSTPTGSYTIILTGSAQGVTHQTSATLVVQPAITNYTIDWGLSSPSLTPPSPSVGDLVMFNIVVSQVSSDWSGSLSVLLNVKLDGNFFDQVIVYQDQVIPPGITKNVSTKPWTATAGAHVVTWELTFFGGDETVILRDPSVANNEASLQIVVNAATSTIQTVTQVQTTTETMTAGQSSTKSAATFTIGDDDLIVVGLIAAIVILIAVMALRRHRHTPAPPPTVGGSRVVTTGFCVNCGAPLKPDVKFCGSCGERVEQRKSFSR